MQFHHKSENFFRETEGAFEEAEGFFQRMMALYVPKFPKNSTALLTDLRLGLPSCVCHVNQEP